jgi:[1-hydroxy-2-(trimethylamino)ethyl]phosphonate dioxygenase
MTELPAIVNEIEQLYAARAQGNYFGEAITQLEHGLQCAHFAEAGGASESVVIAALLHDIGHLVVDVPEDLADWTEDARHEETGADWLGVHFGPAVTEPVRLHVAAKRYLCATDADYFGRLSEASVHTLKLQGGPMSAEEVAAFEANPYARDAVLLRLCDEQGKVIGFSAPALSTYRQRIAALLR